VTARIVLTGIQRAAVLVLLVAGLVVGSCLPSWASFTDSSAVSTTVATDTVVAPTNLTARIRCTGNTASVTLTWNASTSARVTGYRILVHFGGGAYQDQPSVAAPTTTWSGSTDVFYVNNYEMSFTVWTLTDYGWTAESLPTPRVLC
jgi:hypothetical protein